MRRLPKDVMAGVPIVGVTGVNGAGKTTLAVQSAIHDLVAGREVYSTVAIRYVTPEGLVLESKPIRSLRELLELRGATVLLDDVAVIFSSRTTQSLPPEMVALLDTTRHKGLRIIWTAPSWMRCDNLLRGVTQAVLNVVPLPFFREVNDTPWPRPRVIMAGLMDTTSGKVDETPTKVLRRRVYRQRGLAAFGAYDTHADTPLLGRHQSTGVCPDCGGSRTRPKHSPELHELLGVPWFDDVIQRASPEFVPAVDTVVETPQPVE